MITTTADRIRLILQGGGGKPFTVFVDGLLRTHGLAHGVPDAEVDTNVRTNIKDGGVDTEVRVGIQADTSGWFSDPTIWQYKGTSASGLRAAELVKGAHLMKRIEEGWAYRLALADSMTAPARQKLEQELAIAFKKWNPASPSPRIVTADELATWANRYPGLVLATFSADAGRDLLHLDGWARTARDATDVFVPIPEWAVAESTLAGHLDFGAPTPPSAMRTVQGEAGVGKSRLVYETVRAVPGAAGLVIYTLDERALDVAHRIINEGNARLILVADECALETRYRLGKLLDGHRGRVRVIAIDNSLVRLDAPDPELTLGKMPAASLEDVLAKNFPAVDAVRRRAYAGLAQGFPRLAADLCRYDPVIAARGDLRGVIPKINEFYRVRLSETERRAMAALGLVTKIGYSAELSGELDTLCDFLLLDRRAVQAALDNVHGGPGFAARAGRYFYVTPELIARVAFEDGWRTWAQADPDRFLTDFPPALLDAFLNRVLRSAPEEVRAECARRFRDWAELLTANDLTDLPSVRRLVALADTRPNDYLPLIRRLVESASTAQLAAIVGASPSGFGAWGPRRHLVWLAERFAQLPEHWDESERLLARLAAAESEPGIGNNATAIWIQGFRLFLSGTATPFGQRLSRLRERLRDPRGEVRAVAQVALKAPISTDVMRMAGPAVVAGRIPPKECMPTTNYEVAQCLEEALALFADAAAWDGETRAAVLEALTDQLRRLIRQGFLAEVRAILDRHPLSDSERVALIDKLDTILEYDFDDENEEDTHVTESDRIPSVPTPTSEARRQALAAAVRAWRADLAGTDLYSRLLACVGKDRWGTVRLRDAADWQREVDAVASDLASALLRGESLARELDWLTTPAAQSAGELGEALGRKDQRGALFDRVLATVASGREVTLARGYAHGLLGTHPEHGPRLIAWLDNAETSTPELAADIALGAGPLVEPLDRVLRLFDAGRLPATYLYGRNFPPGELGELTAAATAALLERLATAAEAGDRIALRVGLDNLAMRLPYRANSSPHTLLQERPELLELGWRLLDAVPENTVPASHWWGALLVHLGRFDPARAARYLAKLLGSDSLVSDENITQAAAQLAETHPSEVMDAVGKIMLDKRIGLRFVLGNYKALFGVIPDDVKQAWVERTGVAGAQLIARHLPQPYVTSEGEPMVPSFTAWLLERFAEDERTFHEFYAGTHSWQWYSGDIAAEHEAEAAVARQFLDHPLRRIREWAALEERRALQDARAERQRAAEQDLP